MEYILSVALTHAQSVVIPLRSQREFQIAKVLNIVLYNIKDVII